MNKPDNTPPAVKAVLDKPGKYIYMGWSTWYFEVDENRRVYQLDPCTMTRDGYLSPEGWNPHASGVVKRIEEKPDAT